MADGQHGASLVVLCLLTYILTATTKKVLGGPAIAERTRVLQYSLGPIGSAIACYVLQTANLQLVGGVDIDPVKRAGTRRMVSSCP
jgi:hypothetical protein